MIPAQVIGAYIARHEGEKLKPYLDTQGHLTIGLGRCLDRVGISHEEAQILFQNDCYRVEKEIFSVVSDFEDLPQNAQLALFDMCFQMGAEGLRGFHKMLLAIHSRDWEEASKECLDSVYHKQTPSRCEENAQLLRNCS